MKTLEVGAPAPQFEGENQFGKQISLANYHGKKVILYFYPKDSTPGCTSEACDLNDNYAMWQAKGYEVIGVSPDSVASHLKFAEKYNLSFQLIADTERTILEAYGAWGEKKMYGKAYMGVLRKTFVINEKGIIEAIFEKVDTKAHSKQILDTLQ